MPFPTPSVDFIEKHVAQRVATLGVQAPPSAVPLLASRLHHLHAWNQRIDLTAVRSLDELLDLRLILVEPAAKRLAFLRTVVGSPGLEITALRDRVVHLAPSQSTWQAAIARASS